MANQLKYLHFRWPLLAAFLCLLNPAALTSNAAADSSSPSLAAYYDRQMAIVNGAVYAWKGSNRPQKLAVEGIQVGVSRDRYFVLQPDGALVSFTGGKSRAVLVATNVIRFAAGQSGVLTTRRDGTLWWRERGAAAGLKIATSGVAMAVGDGANYFVTDKSDLFVKGKAHRGQYGNGQLTPSGDFVRTARDILRVTAHTGHAIALKRNGDVIGTGGNIFGPVGRHGLGDKAVKWSKIIKNARAVATGASHSLAIRQDGTLWAWGSEYGPEPRPVMAGVRAMAAGSRVTIALKRDGSLWQWDRGQQPRRVMLK